jgi:pantothenate kinase
MTREFESQVELKEFAPRNVFLNEFSSFVGGLSDSVAFLENNPQEARDFTRRCREIIRCEETLLSPEEVELFENTFDLFSRIHSLPPHDRMPNQRGFARNDTRQEIAIEIGGPIAVSKSTLAKALAP